MDQQTSDHILKVTQKTTLDTTTTTDAVLMAVFQENLGRCFPSFLPTRVAEENHWK